MLWKSSHASIALATVVANTFTGASAIPLMARDAASGPDSIVFTPAPSPGAGFAKPSDVQLLSQDKFYWNNADHGLLGTMAVTAADKYRLLNAQRFSGVVESVDCSSSNIKLAFTGADGFNSAKSSWAWLNSNPDNKIVYVVDDGACGGANGRQPYYISSISYDAGSNSAVLASSTANWKDFAADASIRFHGDDSATSAKRDIGDNVTIDLSHDFSRPMLTTSWLDTLIQLGCSDCQTTGGLDADITLSLSNGFEASVTTINNFGFHFALSITASGSVDSPWDSSPFEIASFPLGGISIAGIVEIGPEINIIGEATIAKISGSVTAEAGLTMVIPDGQGFTLGQGTNLSPQWGRIGPSISGQVDVQAVLSPEIKLILAGTFLGEGMVGGLALYAPVLTADVEAQVNSAGGVCTSTGTFGVNFKLNVGLELDGFAGFGGATDMPNKTKLYSVNTDLVDQCIAITN